MEIGSGARRRTNSPPHPWALTALVGLLLLAASPAEARVSPTVFHYTGNEQMFTVPAGVTSIHVAAVGAPGGNAGASGGLGASAAADLKVTPGEALYIEVGGVGGNASGTTGGTGGFNGGGSAPTVAVNAGAGGGGASDVRTVPASQGAASLSSRQIVAGGGGGGGGDGGAGAGAGGAAGQPGQPQPPSSDCSPITGKGCGGGAGTAASGGPGGTGTGPCIGSTGGAPGMRGAGGSGGGDSGCTTGGGGGGGLYGGGGGGAGSTSGGRAGGGGGGSSGFGSTASHTSVAADSSGVPNVTLTYKAAVAPSTKITKAKINTEKGKASFSFKAKGSSNGFQCALVHGHGKPKFKSCRSPKSYKRLKPGKYKFEVRALGPGGKDPTPATKKFKI